jgi:uncharacterized caspase-like protein
MQQFLQQEASFEQILFFSDDSPDVHGVSTLPTRGNLRRMLRKRFEDPFMEAGDNLWFFFSGHGMRHNNRDYLMPCDGDPDDIENTAISINYVNERLRRCGADNVIMILDACRSLGSRAGEGIGREAEEVARQTGVISIFSCSPQEYSYEIEELQQGAFTRALLDGLGIQGKCATVERLNQYLTQRVRELVSQHKNARQNPYIIAEPIDKYHLILVPQYATLADISLLKNDAYRAQTQKQYDLAQQLWIRVLAAASGRDMEAVKALQTIARLRGSSHLNIPTPAQQTPPQTKNGQSKDLNSENANPPLHSSAQPLLNQPPVNDDKSKSASKSKILSNFNKFIRFLIGFFGAFFLLALLAYIHPYLLVIAFAGAVYAGWYFGYKT